MDQDDYILPHVPRYASVYDSELHTNTVDDYLKLVLSVVKMKTLNDMEIINLMTPPFEQMCSQ